jgi:hypothetical protein
VDHTNQRCTDLPTDCTISLFLDWFGCGFFKAFSLHTNSLTRPCTLSLQFQLPSFQVEEINLWLYKFAKFQMIDCRATVVQLLRSQWYGDNFIGLFEFQILHIEPWSADRVPNIAAPNQALLWDGSPSPAVRIKFCDAMLPAIDPMAVFSSSKRNPRRVSSFCTMFMSPTRKSFSNICSMHAQHEVI